MKLQSFLALSRTPHAVLDLAAPAFAGLVWLNRFPSVRIVLLGLVTTFAAYTAVYALNDIVDRREDRRRLSLGGSDYGGYLDAAVMRHPIAQGTLSLSSAIAWTAGWGVVAAVGSFLLDPRCLIIFAAAIFLEGAYCRLCTVTPLRAIVAGLVKAAGPIAAVVAVDPRPAPVRLALLFCWLFLWEIGGQNIPADWTDIDEDRRLEARTLPVRLQAGNASRIVVLVLLGAVGLSLPLVRQASLVGTLLYVVTAVTAGAILLLLPALRLLIGSRRSAALLLFKRASFSPLSLLWVMTLKAAL